MKPYPPGLPCWAPGAADHLASMLTGQEVAIEWGSGQSTAWLAPKVLALHTVEHDHKWANKVADQCQGFGNVVVHLHPYADPFYVDVLHNLERSPQPHVWLIDGYKRIKCLNYALRNAKDGDIMVCDDALDYAGPLLHRLTPGCLKHFAMPHPYAGTPIDVARHKPHGNTIRTHHAMTKETWIWRV